MLRKMLIIGAIGLSLSACQTKPIVQTTPRIAPAAAWAMTPPPTLEQIDNWTCEALQLSNCPNLQNK